MREAQKKARIKQEPKATILIPIQIERTLAKIAEILSKRIRIVIVAFGSSPIPVDFALRAWGCDGASAPYPDKGL